MAKLTKKQKALDRDRPQQASIAVDEAIAIVKTNATAKFDETVEVALNLGVDPRHADQMVRGVVNLPKGTGKNVRVAVFAKGDEGRGSHQGGRRRRRRRRPDGDHPGRPDRLRPRHRDART